MGTKPNTSEDNRSDLECLASAPPDKGLKTILKWLTGKDARRSNLAGAVLLGMGKAPTDRILREALAPRTPVQHRIRLLQMIERIGQPLEPGQWFTLFSAAETCGPPLRDQIRHLLAWNREISSSVRSKNGVAAVGGTVAGEKSPVPVTKGTVASPSQLGAPSLGGHYLP